MTTPTIIQFVIEGNPIPKGRARSGKGHFYTPQTTREWELRCQQEAMVAMVGRGPFEGYVAFSMVFYRANLRRVDYDNLVKAASDAFNGIVWRDDSQVVAALPIKGFDKNNPRVEVQVRGLEQGHLHEAHIVAAFWAAIDESS